MPFMRSLARYILYVTLLFFFFFFNDTATTEIYTLSLHDALPISSSRAPSSKPKRAASTSSARCSKRSPRRDRRSEEHTSELQSLTNLVCRLLLEKKKKKQISETLTKKMSHR